MAEPSTTGEEKSIAAVSATTAEAQNDEPPPPPPPPPPTQEKVQSSSSSPADEQQLPKADSYIKTTTGNFVSRKAEITNAKNVEIKGRSWIEEGVIIRGDLAKIRMGRYCKLSTGTSLQPAPATPSASPTPTAASSSQASPPSQQEVQQSQASVPHVPVVIGSHTIIGPNCQIRAAAIGSYCWIGRNVTMGPRVIVKDACVIEDNVTLGDDAVIPPFTQVTTMTIPNHNLTISSSNPETAAPGRTTTTKLLQMIELPPATIQLLQEESMEIYNLNRKSIQTAG
ncbi:hypothetical protein ACA910_016373 [Epithemia clementina (nom. ined.)]